MTKPSNSRADFSARHAGNPAGMPWRFLVFTTGCVLLLAALIAHPPFNKYLIVFSLVIFTLGYWLTGRISATPQHVGPTPQTSRRLAFIAHMDALAETNPALKKVALLLINLDRFITINDHYGHRVGDQLLVALDQRIRQLLAQHSLMACELFHLQGDEFVVVCPHANNQDAIKQLAQDITTTAQEPLKINGSHLLISISMGIGWSDNRPHTRQQLIRAADIAMRHVKNTGKNYFAFFDDVHPFSVVELIKLESRLRNASNQGEIVPYYQPIVDMQSGKVVALEALARWPQTADSTFKPPKDWMRYASPGLLTDISQFVLLQAQMDALMLAEMGVNDLQININITESMLFREEFREILAEVCNNRDTNHPLIAVELTETIFVDRAFDIIKAYLERIRDTGSKIYLDDFGTGFASLNHLRDLPVDALKIDKEFIIHLDQPTNQAIVQAMIDLAGKLDKNLICEGVESEAHQQKLRQMGARYGQGYLYSPAVPLDALPPLLQIGRPALSQP